jgi:hypothetical protein
MAYPNPSKGQARGRDVLVNDWQKVILGVALAGMVSWVAWASLAIANLSKDVAFIQGRLAE